MDILIVNPGEIRHDYITEHLGIASLTAYVNSKGYSAEQLDMAIEEMSVLDGQRKVLEINPKMLGLSLLDDSKKKGIALIQSVRKAGYKGKIVIGGYFPTFASYEILRDFTEIDYIVRGEGELTLHQLLEVELNSSNTPLSEIKGLSYRKNGKIIENDPRPLIEDLDILPPVDRKYAQKVLDSKVSLRIYSTRGCWGQCSFCDIIGFYSTSPGKAWRRRSSKSLVDEIEFLKNRYKTNFFNFNDDQFLVKGKKAVEFVDEFVTEIKNRNLKIQFDLMVRADTINKTVFSKLKSAGLQRVFLGLESFDKKHLIRYNKKISWRQNVKALIILKRLKIDMIASVILTDAYTTLWNLITQFIFLYDMRKRYFNSRKCQISLNKQLEVYRGSAVYQQYKSKGLLTNYDYLKKIEYKLKFFTSVRLKMFQLEEKINRIVLKPREVYINIIKKLRWLGGQVMTWFSNPESSVER